MELNSVEIGKRIKMIRCKRQLSQIAFAAELHVSREQISRWENGDVVPDVETLNSYFGYTIQNDRGKPTNSEFIAMIADNLRLKYKLYK